MGKEDIEYSKELARYFFEQLGYTVNDIPNVHGKLSADLYASDINGLMPPAIIEAKEKRPGSKAIKNRRDSLKSGKVFDKSSELKEHAPLNKFMAHAVNQLRDTAPLYSSDVLKIVFIICSGFNAESRFEQIRIRVTGTATIIDFSENGQSNECAFFEESDMFKYRDIVDAFVLVKDNNNKESFEAGFFINPYAHGYTRLSNCKHFQVTLKQGFIDIPKKESSGDYWSLHDVKGSRSEERKMLEAVKVKYGLSRTTVKMVMNHFSAEVLVP